MTQVQINKNLLRDFDLSQLDAHDRLLYKEYKFLGYTKEEALQRIIKECEGNYKYLSEGLRLVAEEIENN